VRENRGFSLASSDLVDTSASLDPLLKLCQNASRYPQGVAGALVATILSDRRELLLGQRATGGV